MVVQATGVFFPKASHAYLFQDVDDNNDDENKQPKKEVKEFVSHSLLFHHEMFNKINFNLYRAFIVFSPVIDHLTPPPDGSSNY